MIEVVYKEPKLVVNLPELQTHNHLCIQFTNWLRQSPKGGKYCYFSGKYISGASVGRLAFDAYEREEVILFQERTGTEFNYWAQRV